MSETSDHLEKGFEYVDELTYADIAFRAYGKDLSEMFANAALATSATMVSLDTVDQKEERKIELTSKDLDDLLFSFLEDIVALKDSDSILFSEFAVTVKKENETYTLVAICKGDTIDENKQELENDVKAVTYHEFKTEDTGQGWMCQVILDV
jgi:SHS2 domain-containing protein